VVLVVDLVFQVGKQVTSAELCGILRRQASGS
jgi:hypothetical protein